MRKPKETKAPARTIADDMNAARERFSAMESVAGRFTGWRPARDVLTRVKGVQTDFPSVDLLTKIGGWPIERPSLVHGPSNHGKTELCLGLGKSFLRRGHFFALVDAEFSTPMDWLVQLGIPMNHPGFHAKRPRTYEDTRDAVRSWAEGIGDAKARGELPEDMTGICVVDSLTKLNPKDLLDKLAKEFAADDSKPKGGRRGGKAGYDGANGRAGMIKAHMNNAWMNDLVPLVGQTGVSVVIITREYDNADADFWEEDFKVAGGNGPFFDSSLVVRVTLAGSITHGEGADKKTYGERHGVTLRKTKIGRKETRYPKGYYNSSNGTLVPAGFDTPRDYLDLAQELGEIEIDKGHNHFLGKRNLGRGEHAAVKRLHQDAELFSELREATRAAMKKRLDEEPGAVAEPDASSPSPA
jgi:hypothetical protein